MIFATVGTQLPFDRMLTALDDWASRNASVPVLAQSGASAMTFRHIEATAHIDQPTFAARMASARVIVAHAGMGTILSAAEAGKRLILMPRRAEFGEHRNDHQLATAEEMSVLSCVTVAHDAETLWASLDAALADQTSQTNPFAAVSSMAEPRLINALQEFIWAGKSSTSPARAPRPFGVRA
jgi:UDP-N-acetylglucosamine transferase subunit ALG13